MTRIGLLGVPGSGKSALAQTLKTAIEMEDKGSVVVVDDYVPEIEEECGLALGFDASYVGDLHVALGRAQRERKAKETAEYVITCGTLLETSTYVVTDGLASLKFADPAQQQDDLRRIESTMRVIACLYMDTFHYEHVFYLPPTAVDDERFVQLDKNLQVAFSAFQLTETTPLMVDGGTALEVTEKRCAEALKEIFGDS